METVSMKRLLGMFPALALMAFAASALAGLPVGAKAPLFTAPATIGGKVFTFSLAKSLKKGPVVLYFYPAAFTKGCTIEAHEFAAAMPKYHALGATVIGVSHDKLSVLKRFSVSECRSKFPVAADTDQSIMKSYHSVLTSHPKYANRTSYVITPNDKILYTYTNLNPHKHVTNTLAALKKWRAAHPQSARR
jgi:peroxiredoxin